MSRRLITDDLLAEVRSLIDEINESNIDDVRDLLPALNRAQDYAANLLARRYEEPLLTNKTVTLVPGQAEYPIPEDAFETRLEKVELFLNQFYAEVDRIDFRDLTDFEAPLTTNVPYYYAIVGRNYRIVPTPSSAQTMRVWYLKDPLPLVKAQGRVLSSPVANYLVVDAVGEDLSTNTEDLNSYVNVIDGDTGEIKGALQIQSIDSENHRVTFKATPDRTLVLNREVTGDATALSIEPDDYICTIHGSCIPFFKKPIANFMITYAAADIKVNKLNGEPGLLTQQLSLMENQVERLWVGQEQTHRVKLTNRNFGSGSRRRRRRFLYNS